MRKYLFTNFFFINKEISKNLWSSRNIFILAAIGSAAGLGNLWKFPFQVYDNGGAAFIVAYLVILVVM